MAIDEHPVEPRVHQVGDENRRDDGAGSAQRLQALAKDDEEEKRQHARGEAHRVGRGERDHLRGLVGPAEHRARREEDGNGRDGQQRSQDEPTLDAARDAGLIVRANRLGDHRIEHHQRAHAEDADAEEIEVTQRDCREAHRRAAPGEVPDHDGVHDPHEHHADLDRHHGDGEPDHAAQLALPGEHPAEAGRSCHGIRAERSVAPRPDRTAGWQGGAR